MSRAEQDMIAAAVIATARVLALHIAPEHMPGLLENFARLAAMAEQVLDAPGQDTDPAAVFRPGRDE